MHTDMTRMAIKVLKQLFFDPEKADEWMAIASMELDYDMGLFNNVDRTAMLIYEEQAFGLVDKLELVDVKLAKEIRKWLNME